MMTDQTIIRKIYVIVLALVLFCGAFFSISAELVFAEDMAQDAETEVVAVEGSEEPTQPAPSSEPASGGDTSDPNLTVDKEEPTAGSDDAVVPDSKEAVETDANGNGDEPVTDNVDKIKDNDSKAPAVSSSKAGETLKAVAMYEPKDEPKDEPRHVEEESLINGFKLDLYEHRAYIDYEKSLDADGSIRLRGFFHSFLGNEPGIETLTIEITYGERVLPYQYNITHYSDGSYEGDLPFGFRVENNDLVIGWLWPDANVTVSDGALTSSASSESDDARDEPAPKPAEKKTLTVLIKDEVGTPSAVAASKVTSAFVPPVEEVLPANITVDNSDVLSSYNKSDSGDSVMDATNDNDSPINATTAMMAGVAALFVITMSLVIAPKV